MKTNIKLFLVCILIVGLMTTSSSAQSSTNSRTASREPKKVIAVVLDDSTSMVRDDPGKQEKDYTIRWVEADYSVRALAAMMDSGDELCIYPLNETKPFSLTIGQNNLESALFNKLDNMGYYGDTKFDRVREAAEYLKSVRGKECYLVVITDGNFRNADDDEMTQAELDASFDAVLVPEIQAHYIQIGTVGDSACLPSNPGIRIHQDQSNGITRQITDVLNEIYHRIAIEDKDTLIAYPSEGTLTVKFDIPIQSTTIFLQGNADWDSIQLSAEPYTWKSTEIFSKPPNFPALWHSPREFCKIEWIKNGELSGLVINCSAPIGGSTEPITVSGVPAVDKGSIQVYYEPAVEQRISISQANGLSFTWGEPDSLFVEGPIDITVDYWNLDGKPLDLSTATMLKNESTYVEVNGRTFSGTLQADGRYVYSGLLSSDDAGSSITISNTIGLNGGKYSIPIGNIYEPNMALILELAQEQPELMLDWSGHAVLPVIIKDEISGAPLEWTPGTVLNCTSEHFNTGVYSPPDENGVILIPLTLKDVEEHQIDAVEQFTIIVSAPYSDDIRPPASKKMEFPAVQVSSEPHELSIKPENTFVTLIDAFLFGETIPITYSCDEIQLSEEQLRDATITLELNDAVLDGLITLENGNIRLKQLAWQWFGVRGQDYEAQLTFSYTKWNQPAKISTQFTLNLSPITGVEIVRCIAVVVLGILVVFALIWFIWWCKWGTKNDDFIKSSTSFTMQSLDDPEDFVNLEWKLYDRVLFRINFWGKRYARVRRCLSEGTKDDGTLPTSINFYIAREGDRWRLGKIDTHMRPTPAEGCLKIDGTPVSDDNCRFLAGGGFQSKLELNRGNYTNGWYLKITETE